MSREVLREHRATWMQKPILREIYHDFYRRILAFSAPGKSLEIGGGSGNLKEYSSDVISTDIVPNAWLDAAADAQALPFANAIFANVVMVDVLHHIERPIRFLAEALRVLRPGGRLLMVEPAITPVSWLSYRFFHPEPVVMTADPLADGAAIQGREPFDANQAIPTLLFGRYRRRLEALFPALELIHFERFSFFAYPLSGGFRPWSLLPPGWGSRVIRMEDALAPMLGPLMAFRLLAVLEKQARGSANTNPVKRPLEHTEVAH